MNINLLLSKLQLFGDSQTKLAEALGISRGTLSKKINNKASFTLPEIVIIKKRYSLSAEEIDLIFFANLVS